MYLRRFSDCLNRRGLAGLGNPLGGRAMVEIKPTLQWAEQTLRTLSKEAYTGTLTIRFSQGGVQGMSIQQELQPRQDVRIVDTSID